MALGKRIQQRLQEIDKTPAWLCSKIPRLKIGTLSALINRDSERSEFAGEIAEALDVSLEWLLYGDQRAAPQRRQIFSDEAHNFNLLPVRRVLFKLSAGVSGFEIEPENGDGVPIFFRADWMDSRGYDAAKLFTAKVSGPSMEPSLYEGDLVVVNTEDTEPKDGEVFAMNYEGELVIKRLRRDGGEWWACSDNADQRRYAPKRCMDGVFVIGRVVYKQSERI